MSDKKTLEEQCLKGCQTPHRKPFFQIDDVKRNKICSESFRFLKQNTMPLPCQYCNNVAIEVKNHKSLKNGWYHLCTYQNKIIDPDLLSGLQDQYTEE